MDTSSEVLATQVELKGAKPDIIQRTSNHGNPPILPVLNHPTIVNESFKQMKGISFHLLGCYEPEIHIIHCVGNQRSVLF